MTLSVCHVHPCHMIKHFSDELGPLIKSQETEVTNLAELRQALLEEWDRIPRVQQRRLVITII